MLHSKHLNAEKQLCGSLKPSKSNNSSLVELSGQFVFVVSPQKLGLVGFVC